MKILALGDIAEPRAVLYLKAKLPAFVKANKIDFVVANGENAAFINPPSPELAREILDLGVDCMTGGNHTMRNRYLHPMLDNEARLLRPQNYPPAVAGRGYTVLTKNGVRILCMNVMGRVHIEPPLDSPFDAIDRVLSREAGKYDVALLDIHAEATGEKLALAHYFDGRIAVIFGTHTHIPTADEHVMPKGTGYITDLGMCGSADGILGVAPSGIIERMTTGLPVRVDPDTGDVVAMGAIFTVDTDRKCCTDVTRVRF